MKRLLHQTVSIARRQALNHWKIPGRGGSPTIPFHARSSTTMTMKLTIGCHSLRSTVSVQTEQRQQQQQNQPLRPYSSTLDNSTSSSNVVSSSSSDRTTQEEENIGEEWYQKAIQAMDEALEVEKEIENKKSQQVGQALQKAKDAERAPSTQGVVVVKTIAKQARKQRKQNSTMEETNTTTPAEMIKQRALEYLEIAANDYNHPIALVQLGTMALEKAGKTSSTEEETKEQIYKAMDLFRRAGQDGGSRVGWFNLGQLLWSGYPALVEDEKEVEKESPSSSIGRRVLEPNIDEALEAFTKAIELGDPDAMYLVGVSRMSYTSSEDSGSNNAKQTKNHGDSDHPNIVATMHSSGLALIEQAANLGHGGALYYLALLALDDEASSSSIPLEAGEGLAPSSTSTATTKAREATFIQRLDEAVKAGNADALFTRGHCYYHGSDGYAQNYRSALQDFLLAAEVGQHADAAVSAGAILHNGVGAIIPQDQQRAFELYQQAGEWGSREGWQNVVACYLAGEGVPQSLETANYIAKTMLQKSILPEDNK